MTLSQGTQPSKMNKREAILAFIEAYKSSPEIWDTENRQNCNRVKKAAAYGTLNDSLVFIHHSHTHKKTHRIDKKKKLTNLMGNLCCVREHSVQFFVQFFYTVKQHSLTAYGALKNLKAQDKICSTKFCICLPSCLLCCSVLQFRRC
jgi:hypothetical protein